MMMKAVLAVLLAASIFVAGAAPGPDSETEAATVVDNSTIVAVLISDGFEMREDAAGYFIRVWDHYWAYPVPATLSFEGPSYGAYLTAWVVDTRTGSLVPGAYAFNNVPSDNLSPHCGDSRQVDAGGPQGTSIDNTNAVIYSSCFGHYGRPSFARITYVPAGDYRIVAQQSSNLNWVRIAGFNGEAWFYMPFKMPSLNVALER